jgi:hypothetical protein
MAPPATKVLSDYVPGRDKPGSSPIHIEITGVRNVLKRFDLSKKGAENGLTIGFAKAALHLATKSTEIVPVLTGLLRSSLAISPVRGVGMGKEVSVSFGNQNVDYAIYVHEDPDAAHKSGKTYKFLERPAMEEQAEILKIIGKGVEEGIRRAL